MADFLNRLVSRTLSGLEPTVKPMIAPLYASGVTMADNSAMDIASEWDLSASTEYDSDESPMEQSQELLRISETANLNPTSNVTPVNLGAVPQLNSQDTVDLQPTSSETSEPQDNLADTTSNEHELDSAIAPENPIKTNSTEESPSPITPLSEPLTIVQQSTNQNTPQITPAIKPLDNSSQIISNEHELDSASAPENPIKTSSAEDLSSSITPLSEPSTIVQQSANQNAPQITPAIKPLDNSSQVISNEHELDSASAPENPIKASPLKASLITPSTTIQRSSNSPANSASKSIKPTSESSIERSLNVSQHPPEVSSRLVKSQVADLNSYSSSNEDNKRKTAIAPETRFVYTEDSSFHQLDNQSSLKKTSKVSLPLVKSEVITPLSSPSPNPSGGAELPINRVESISSTQINPAVESDIPAVSNSSPLSSASTKHFVQSNTPQAKRSPIASETVSQSPGLLKNQTVKIKPQSNFSRNNPLMSSLSKPDSGLLRTTKQFNPKEQEVPTQKISANKGERITSKLNSKNNNLNFLTDTVISKPRLDKSLDRADSISTQIKPRLEITSQEIAQISEQSSDLANYSSTQPSSSQLSPTRRQETVGSNQISGTIATAESTPTINITIGRVEVRGVKPPEPPPIKKSRSKTPQLSLNDYLDQRRGK